MKIPFVEDKAKNIHLFYRFSDGGQFGGDLLSHPPNRAKISQWPTLSQGGFFIGSGLATRD
jgi:hypothetical protein